MRCTSRRCSTGSSRTCAATSATTSSTSPPSSRRNGWPRTSTSRSAAPSPAPTCAPSSPRPTTRSGGRRPTWSGTSDDELPVWHEPSGRYLDPHTGELLPTWDQALDAIGPHDQPLHVARFGPKFDAQGVLAGTKDADRCIGYLTKYLTKQLGGCHTAEHRRPADHADPARRRAPVRALLTGLRELAPLRHPAQEPPARPACPACCRGKAHRPRTSATPDAASWSPANGPAKPSPTTAPTAKPG